MRLIRFSFVRVSASTFAARSNAESDSFEDNSSNSESMKSLYGIESAAYDQKTDEVPAATAGGMASVLEVLRRNGNTVRNCESETTEGFYGDATDKKVMKMFAEYQARTRSGAFVEQFALCVSLDFNIDKGMVCYVGTTYSPPIDLFSWQGYGASLSTTTDGNSIFNSTTYLYSRVSDQGNCVVKVPINFKGSYNSAARQGTYSFTLKAAKQIS